MRDAVLHCLTCPRSESHHHSKTKMSDVEGQGCCTGGRLACTCLKVVVVIAVVVGIIGGVYVYTMTAKD
ncbi:hypothetical protein GE061_002928 [Apolygus lucorum]|uniref:Uncharacterized protein n=1 Tax=Apolygus lucorum TaxID=248454 RepID=A0A6A4JI26_APOLU|nr:hypothetical protein GE061_002928 [Apolygus lucorum]